MRNMSNECLIDALLQLREVTRIDGSTDLQYASRKIKFPIYQANPNAINNAMKRAILKMDIDDSEKSYVKHEDGTFVLASLHLSTIRFKELIKKMNYEAKSYIWEYLNQHRTYKTTKQVTEIDHLDVLLVPSDVISGRISSSVDSTLTKQELQFIEDMSMNSIDR